MTTEELVSKVKELLPSLAILPELRRLLKSEESSIEDVVKIVNTDQSLVAKVIKLSNSPFYGGDGQCNNIDDAIARIGFHEVYKIIAVLLANPLINEDSTVYDFDPTFAWKESLSCAVTMQHLAKFAKLDSDTAYTTGLLHSIGRSAISSYYSSATEEELNEVKGKVQSHKNEQEIIGFDHAEVGADLLDKWNFPEEITTPVRNQFSRINKSEDGKSTYALHISKLLMPHLDLKTSDILIRSEIQPAYLERIGMDEIDLIDCIKDIKASIANVDQMLTA